MTVRKSSLQKSECRRGDTCQPKPTIKQNQTEAARFEPETGFKCYTQSNFGITNVFGTPLYNKDCYVRPHGDSQDDRPIPVVRINEKGIMSMSKINTKYENLNVDDLWIKVKRRVSGDILKEFSKALKYAPVQSMRLLLKIADLVPIAQYFKIQKACMSSIDSKTHTAWSFVLKCGSSYMESKLPKVYYSTDFIRRITHNTIEKAQNLIDSLRFINNVETGIAGRARGSVAEFDKLLRKLFQDAYSRNERFRNETLGRYKKFLEDNKQGSSDIVRKVIEFESSLPLSVQVKPEPKPTKIPLLSFETEDEESDIIE